MLHLIFEQSAMASPQRIAVQYENEKPITYQDLDQLSNQLGHAFLASGIKPRQPVPVQLPRSANQVVVLLALSKIGAIYVPVSPEQAPSKFKQIFIDCSPTHVITDTSLKESINAPLGTTFICLDADQGKFLSYPIEKPVIADLGIQDVAYIAYSSGTTGLPKGIPIRHAGMSEYWQKILKSDLKHSVTAVLANASIDFDAHVWEYLMAWCFGATLYLTSEETRKDAERLAHFMNSHRITDATLTPAVLRMFVSEHIRMLAKSGLKAIYSTGEACTEDIVAKFAQFGVKTYNCYGPTEATFGLSMILCQLASFFKGLAPIGLPPSGGGGAHKNSR